jgi:maleamate amidohydrolase
VNVPRTEPEIVGREPWEREGFGGRAGLGECPALIVVDMNLGFTDTDSPLSCDLDDTVTAISRLLEAARATEVPVAFTTLAYGPADRIAAAAFIRKIPALDILERGTRWVEIDPRLAPAPEELVLTKLFASAFFGTMLESWLRTSGVDTLIVTGASTSGCVRATVVDAVQFGLVPIVPEEAVGDRNPAAHRANLFDMDAKYGDVLPLEEVLAYLESLRTLRQREHRGPEGA